MKKSMLTFSLLSLLSLLLRVAAFALMLITMISAWAGNGLGLLQWLIVAVLFAIAGLIDSKFKDKTDGASGSMSLDEFITRCYQEYADKDPKAIKKSARLQKIVTGAVIIVFVFIYFFVYTVFITPLEQEDNFLSIFIGVFIFVFVLFMGYMLSAVVFHPIIERAICPVPYNAIKKAAEDKSYMNYPKDYPYSILYTGEPYPFGRTDVQPVSEPAPAVSTPAPAQPEQVTVTCEQCGQPMLIPHISGAVKITCPKCGNSFIHNN